MTEIFLVPLNKLDVDPKNVRKTYSTEGIEALAANIRADGYTLLQNLVVRKGSKRGRYFVTAGGRRRAALELLAKAGEIAKTFLVECKERSADEATGISIAENTMREDMHPVDQFEAFRALADEGKAIGDIAARFGTTETIVRRRLALARVSPRLLERYRAEEMPFDQLTAFTICDDHARQEEVWDSLPSWSRSAHAIRRALTGEAVSSTDKRVVFLGGLDAYEAAGGAVKRDLFDADGGGYATDSAALDRIVAEKLEAAAETVRGEGWKWVECDIALPDHVCSLTRIYPESVPLSDPEQAELDRLSEEYDDLAERIEAEDGDEDLSEQLETVSERIDQLQATTQTYDAEQKAKAGAFVVLDYHGGLRIERGLVLAEDEVAEADEPADNSGQGSEPEKPKLTHSAALIEDLTAQKTAALRVELANNADVALAAVVHALLLAAIYPSYGRTQSALQISLSHERIAASMKKPDDNRAMGEMESLCEQYGDRLPGNPEDLWVWCLDQTRDDLLSLLAFAAAHSVNAVETKQSGDRKSALAHADQLGCALAVDMCGWFEPTAESYFNHINRQSIEAAVAEVRGKDFAYGIASMKKAEAASYGEKAVRNSKWLPAAVRIDGMDRDAEPLPEAAE